MSEAAAPERGNVLFAAWLVARAASARLDRAMTGVGLSADEFAIYSALAATDGMTPGELAEWMNAPAATVTSAVARFVRRAHAERVSNPADRRSYCVRLTALGREVHGRAADGFAPVLTDVESSLGTDLPGVERALALLRSAIADETR
ncbi:MAG: MarR family winged helix-turn-helix transcriptional regulator [Beutenbergiaceae bacterium]